MDEMMGQVMDKLIASFIEGKISADELQARYLELRATAPSSQMVAMELAAELEPMEQPVEPLDHVTSQARRIRALMDQLQGEIEAARTVPPAQRVATSRERVNYLAYMAKRV